MCSWASSNVIFHINSKFWKFSTFYPSCLNSLKLSLKNTVIASWRMIQHVSDKILLPSHSQLHKKSCMRIHDHIKVWNREGAHQGPAGWPRTSWVQHSHSLCCQKFTASLPGDFQVVPCFPTICKMEHHFVTQLFSINLYVSPVLIWTSWPAALSLLISGLSFNNNNAVTLTVTGCAFNNRLKASKFSHTTFPGSNIMALWQLALTPRKTAYTWSLFAQASKQASAYTTYPNI